MKKLKELYNREYALKTFYVVSAAMLIFLLGWFVYYLFGQIGGAYGFIMAVLKPLILGLVITYLLSPLVKKFMEKPFGSLKKPALRKIAAVILTFVLVIAGWCLVLGILGFTVTRSLSAFSFADIKEYVMLMANQFSKFWTTIEKQLASMNISLGSVGDMIGRIFYGLKNGATTLLFATIFSIYFLLDDSIRRYWKSTLEVFTSESTRAKMSAFAADADRVFSGYIRGQTLDALIVAIMSSVALMIAGVPYAIVIGILTGVGNLVPYVGPVVGFGSLIFVCLAEGSVKILIIGGIILALVMLIDSNIINPRMISSNVEVHPVLVIVALIAGGRVGGVVGMLVAVPVAALLKLQFEKYVDKKRRKRAEAEAMTENGVDTGTETGSETLTGTSAGA